MAKFRPTLRLAISLTTSIVVLVVAAIALTITYTVSLSTVRDIGRGYATALTATARANTESFFRSSTKTIDSLTLMMKQNATQFDIPFSMPLDVQSSAALADRFCYSMYMAQRESNFSYVSLAFIFDDGSGVSFYRFNADLMAFVSRFRYHWPEGNMSITQKHFYIANATETHEGIDGATHVTDLDARFAAYSSGVSLAGSNPAGMWYPPQMTDLAGNVDFSLPALKPLYNTTNHFIGFVAAVQPFNAISGFLQSVKATPGTEVFAVLSDGFLVGSTHAVPHFEIIEATESAPVQTGCASTADTRYDDTRPVFHGCRKRARQFSAFPPLMSAAQDQSFLFSTAAVKILDTDAGRYFVSVAAVESDYRFWGLSVVLCMPEADVLGDIVRGRNIAIGVTIATIFVAAVLSFVFIHILLAPLADISRRMLETAKLHENTDEARSESMLAEVQDLQRAYTQMNTAIGSFTRYVPRDVVKDLMATGQLCTIAMTPQQCTMLFVDIQGFTTICERVPPDALSDLVSAYFDRASRIVMTHDGLIDKFIGDCIMAVWGAPFAVSNQEVKAVLAGKLLDRDTIVDPLRSMWDEAGELLRVRVGVSTGEVLAGNMGSADRMNYTVIGDSVNLAARLESLNKQFDTRVLVSEYTAQALFGTFVLRLLMPIAVVGKDKPVKVYEVVGVVPTVQPEAFAILDEQEYSGGGLDSSADNSIELGASFSMSLNDSGAKHVRRSARMTSAMLRDAVMACASSDVPINCTEADVAFSQRHTDAVQTYLRKDFAKCISLLNDLVDDTPREFLVGELDRSTSIAASRSVEVLRKQCTHYLQNGCPDDFDGVYHTTEK